MYGARLGGSGWVIWTSVPPGFCANATAEVITAATAARASDFMINRIMSLQLVVEISLLVE